MNFIEYKTISLSKIVKVYTNLAMRDRGASRARGRPRDAGLDQAAATRAESERGRLRLLVRRLAGWAKSLFSRRRVNSTSQSAQRGQVHSRSLTDSPASQLPEDSLTNPKTGDTGDHPFVGLEASIPPTESTINGKEQKNISPEGLPKPQSLTNQVTSVHTVENQGT